MTLKTCPGCQKVQTTKSSIPKGRNDWGLWFNCKNCQSTFILKPKKLIAPAVKTA